MTPLTNDSFLEDKILKARLYNAVKHPFYAAFISRFKHVLTSDAELQTCATNGVSCFYNRNFIEKLTVSDLAFIQCHEILHCILKHFDRAQERDFRLWNAACDFAVNQILFNTFNFIAKGALYDIKFKNCNAEEIYEILKRDSSNGLLDNIETIDDHNYQKDSGEMLSGAGGGKEEQEELIEEILKEQQQAGNTPKELDRLVGIVESTESIPWNEVLRAELDTLKISDFTWNVVNRRFLTRGVTLPSNKVAKKLEIAVALDCSGSIDDEVLNLFLAEVRNICSCFEHIELHLWSFDTEVYNYVFYDENSLDDLFSYKAKGGGGTEFSPNWNFLKKKNIKPQKFLIFTDGYTYDWGNETYCDALFVITTENIKAPFGQTVNLQITR